MNPFGFDNDDESFGFEFRHLFAGSRVRIGYRRDEGVAPDARAEFRNHDPNARRLLLFLEQLDSQPLTPEILATSEPSWHDFLALLWEREPHGRLLVGEHPSVGKYVLHVGDGGMGYPGDTTLLWISPEGLTEAARLSGAKLQEWPPRQ